MSTPEYPTSALPPVPAYGEYAAPLQQQQGLQPYGQPQHGQHPYYAPTYVANRPLRTADMIIGIVLLVFGLFGMMLGVFSGLGLFNIMQGQYDQYGLGSYEPAGGFIAAQAAIIISHLVLFAIATPVTIVLINKRLISFWVPLSAGVIATFVFWGAIMALSFADPALWEAAQNYSGY